LKRELVPLVRSNRGVTVGGTAGAPGGGTTAGFPSTRQQAFLREVTAQLGLDSSAEGSTFRCIRFARAGSDVRMTTR